MRRINVCEKAQFMIEARTRLGCNNSETKKDRTGEKREVIQGHRTKRRLQNALENANYGKDN